MVDVVEDDEVEVTEDDVLLVVVVVVSAAVVVVLGRDARDVVVDPPRDELGRRRVS